MPTFCNEDGLMALSVGAIFYPLFLPKHGSIERFGG
jgi:hypothetical protein